MTKEELEKYARENRKRLDAQEVKLGDVVKVLVGQFAGETGVIVSISACRNDYTDPYYEADMNCEVPDKYKCRSFIFPNNVIGGLSATDFEVIGNRASKQPSKEIKQGDKVRIANNAPSEYRYGFHYRLRTQESEVVELDDDGYMAAIVPMCVNDKDLWFQIPTKYLIKVDAEANEPTAPTIKVGDRVRCKNPIRLANSTDDDFIGTVTDAENGWFIVHMNNGAIFQTYHESDLELVQPKEQTEADEDARIRQMEAEIDEFRKAELDRVLHPEKYTTYEVTIDNVAMDWQRYTADLAHDIAVKIVNKNMDSEPEMVGEYAANVAKSVVEELKRK